jgi:hypothetical protein
LSFVCEVDRRRRVTVAQEWTDRGPEPMAGRVSVEGLARLRAVIDVTACHNDDAAAERDDDHGPGSS